MPDFIVPLTKFEGNLIYPEDGSVWALYMVSGAIYNAYEPDTIRAAQHSQQRFVQSLAGSPSNDFKLLGIKTQSEPEDIIRKCTEGLPDFNSKRYAAYYKQLNVFYQEFKNGIRREYNREYMLAVKLKAEQGSMDKLLGKDVEVANPSSIRDVEQTMFEGIPPEYLARRCTPHHLKWLQQRYISRGNTVPYSPKDTAQTASFGPRAFQSYIFDKNAQVNAYADDFAEKFAAGQESKGKDYFLRNWFTAEHSTMCAVIDPSARTASQPEGAVSYQMLLAVLGYPAEDSDRLNGFTYIVDQQIGVDADFCQCISFDFGAVQKEGARAARARLTSEAAANADDEFDLDDFADTADEQNEFRAQVKEENAQVAVQVATIFAFAHPNWKHLQNTVADIQTMFSNNGFDLRTLPGADEDLWKLMTPGQPLTDLAKDLQQTSTITKYAASLPLRTVRIGSETGFPIAINRENALGQIVRMDLMRATEAGSGSIASSGEPRGGKSYLDKKLAFAYIDCGGTVHIIDMSPPGEYAVVASALPPGESVVVRVAYGSHSMDPLRTYDDDAATAMDVFLDLWLPLLEIEAKSDAGAALINLLNTRAGGYIRSTRYLYEYIRRNKEDKSLRELYNAFTPYVNASWSKLLIDPIDPATAQPKPLPLLSRDNAPRLVVFRTNDLTPPRKGQTARTPRELFTSAAYMAIARYTQERFSRIKDVCVTLADEVAFLGDDPRIPEILIKTPDKMGAKEMNLLIASTQLADDFDANYALIPNRFCFRQREHRNAEAALTWGNIPVTVSTLREITTNMSPLNTDGRSVIPGREGECYMNVNGIARVKILEMPSERARLSDTTASKMIREDDLVAR
ncbi:ATP-binding protein [Gordonia sihwensis]|uniref:ATP-binding protein n=1 Tax=Gordonia sihwensis TaxID=173559 RepID=UPI003D975222